jgi:hypothetical protein
MQVRVATVAHSARHFTPDNLQSADSPTAYPINIFVGHDINQL